METPGLLVTDHETLVRLDSDLNLIPGRAESWEPQDDGKVWLFHLRKDVRFHDGTPLMPKRFNIPRRTDMSRK